METKTCYDALHRNILKWCGCNPCYVHVQFVYTSNNHDAAGGGTQMIMPRACLIVVVSPTTYTNTHTHLIDLNSCSWCFVLPEVVR